MVAAIEVGDPKEGGGFFMWNGENLGDFATLVKSMTQSRSELPIRRDTSLTLEHLRAVARVFHHMTQRRVSEFEVVRDICILVELSLKRYSGYMFSPQDKWDIKQFYGLDRASSLSLANLAHLFPWLVCEYIQVFGSDFDPSHVAPDCPRFVCHPVFVHLIPRQPQYDYLLEWHIKFRCLQEPNGTAVPEVVRQKAIAERDLDYLSDSQRINFLTKLESLVNPTTETVFDLFKREAVQLNAEEFRSLYRPQHRLLGFTPPPVVDRKSEPYSVKPKRLNFPNGSDNLSSCSNSSTLNDDFDWSRASISSGGDLNQASSPVKNEFKTKTNSIDTSNPIETDESSGFDDEFDWSKATSAPANDNNVNKHQTDDFDWDKANTEVVDGNLEPTENYTKPEVCSSNYNESVEWTNSTSVVEKTLIGATDESKTENQASDSEFDWTKATTIEVVDSDLKQVELESQEQNCIEEKEEENKTGGEISNCFQANLNSTTISKDLEQVAPIESEVIDDDFDWTKATIIPVDSESIKKCSQAPVEVNDNKDEFSKDTKEKSLLNDETFNRVQVEPKEAKSSEPEVISEFDWTKATTIEVASESLKNYSQAPVEVNDNKDEFSKDTEEKSLLNDETSTHVQVDPKEAKSSEPEVIGEFDWTKATIIPVDSESMKNCSQAPVEVNDNKEEFSKDIEENDEISTHVQVDSKKAESNEPEVIGEFDWTKATTIEVASESMQTNSPGVIDSLESDGVVDLPKSTEDKLNEDTFNSIQVDSKKTESSEPEVIGEFDWTKATEPIEVGGSELMNNNSGNLMNFSNDTEDKIIDEITSQVDLDSNEVAESKIENHTEPEVACNEFDCTKDLKPANEFDLSNAISNVTENKSNGETSNHHVQIDSSETKFTEPEVISEFDWTKAATVAVESEVMKNDSTEATEDFAKNNGDTIISEITTQQVELDSNENGLKDEVQTKPEVIGEFDWTNASLKDSEPVKSEVSTELDWTKSTLKGTEDKLLNDENNFKVNSMEIEDKVDSKKADSTKPEVTNEFDWTKSTIIAPLDSDSNENDCQAVADLSSSGEGKSTEPEMTNEFVWTKSIPKDTEDKLNNGEIENENNFKVNSKIIEDKKNDEMVNNFQVEDSKKADSTEPEVTNEFDWTKSTTVAPLDLDSMKNDCQAIADLSSSGEGKFTAPEVANEDKLNNAEIEKENNFKVSSKKIEDKKSDDFQVHYSKKADSTEPEVANDSSSSGSEHKLNIESTTTQVNLDSDSTVGKNAIESDSKNDDENENEGETKLEYIDLRIRANLIENCEDPFLAWIHKLRLVPRYFVQPKREANSLSSKKVVKESEPSSQPLALLVFDNTLDLQSLAMDFKAKTESLSMDEVSRDLSLLISGYVERGPYLLDLLVNVRHLALIGQAIKTYDIQVKPTDPSEITLSRLAKIFPWLVCLYVEVFGEDLLVPRLPNCPRYVAHQCFASLIPRAAKYDDLFELHVQCRVVLDRIMRPDPSINDLERYRRQRLFATTARFNPYLDDSQRIHLVHRIGSISMRYRVKL